MRATPLPRGASLLWALLLVATWPPGSQGAVRDAARDAKDKPAKQQRARLAPSVTWTPIYQNEAARVDLWTVSTSGCACAWNASSTDCACCVKEGGCHCGEAAPQRCAQCGLEKYCASMCNATIDSVTVLQRSGRPYGMIKSSNMDAPSVCSFTLLPDAKQRVEIQLYRLVGVGRYHNNSCQGGTLQLTDGTRAARGVSLCGANERFTTPVVMFADRGPATLSLRVTEPSERSQFLAYYSFTPANATGVGFLPKGGKRKENTECDWIYQDFTCAGGCVLASPGYPGLYPGGLSCGYLVTASSVRANVTLELLAVNLPLAHCATDNIVIYHGSGPSGLRVHTICDMSKTVFVLPGPNVYIQFNAGPSKPPYNYNGFLARLDFSKEENPRGEWRESRKEERRGKGHRATSTAAPAATATPAPTALMDGAARGCSVAFSGTNLRSGVLDSRHHAGCHNLSVQFHGRDSDVVKLSIFNYKLRARNCTSHFDIFLGPDLSTPDKRLCSPMTKHAHDPSGRFLSQQTVMSRGPHMALQLVLTASDPEFVDGAWLFHDKSTQGSPETDSLCSARFVGPNVTAAVAAAAQAEAEGRYLHAATTPTPEQLEPLWGEVASGNGVAGTPGALAAGALAGLAGLPGFTGPGWAGSITSPGNQHLFWNVQGQLKCVQTFQPQTGQSVTLSLAAPGLKTDPGCWSYCDSLGCRCFSEPPLSSVDHVRITDAKGVDLSCLCGDPQKIPMPLSIRSWGPLSLEYNVAHFTWAVKGFDMQANYTFAQDGACGRQQILRHTGTIESWRVRLDDRHRNSNKHFVHMDCQWVLLSNIERELRITVATPQSQPCGTWNITIHRYNENEDLSLPIFTFCPRDSVKTYELPWKLNSVIIRLWALSPNVPEFTVKWHSQVAQAIMHKAVGVTAVAAGPPRSAPAAALSLLLPALLVLLQLLPLARRQGVRRAQQLCTAPLSPSGR